LLGPIVAAFLGIALYPLLKLAFADSDRRTPTLDALHFFAAGAASFARGLNDTPKIVAPMLVVPWLGIPSAFLIVAIAIVLGGLLDIKNVAETLGKKVTGMNPGQGFAACLATACLVSTASLHSLPVSTTHVSVGSLCGIGAVARQTHWRKVFEIVLAWVCTVPCGAIIAAIAYGAIALL
jgi:inorganic phosphate transporter, PiT family